MTARDLFGLVVRLLGLASIVAGVFDALGAGERLLNLPTATNATLEQISIVGAVYLALGIAVLLLAPFIVRFAYGSDPSRKD